MYFILYERVPYFLNFVIGPFISYIAILINLALFIALFDKNLRSPSSVIMQGIALADTLTAIFIYGFEPYFMSIYRDIGISGTESHMNISGRSTNNRTEHFSFEVEIAETKALVDVRFPVCIFHYCVSQLAENFHLVTVLLTTCLGLHKISAVKFPFWTREKITRKHSIFVCCSCFLISMGIHIPRIISVSFKQGNSDRGVCLISMRYESFQRYVLSSYPFIYTTILVCSVLVVLLSTFFIIVSIYRRQHQLVNYEACCHERRCSLLITAILVIFLFSEIPRLYIHTSIFDMYRSDLDKKDVVWNKVKLEINQMIYSTSCYKDIEDSLQKKVHASINISSQTFITEKSSVCDNSPGYILPKKSKDHTIDEIRMYFERITHSVKEKIDPAYTDFIDQIFQNFSDITQIQYEQSFDKAIAMVMCHVKRFGFSNFFHILLSLPMHVVKYKVCWENVLNNINKNLPFLILGSSSYSEPMNYLLNIIWTRVDISLKNLKICIEIMKLCTVIACASNFLIYMMMSAKLRDIVTNKLKCTTFSIRSENV